MTLNDSSRWLKIALIAFLFTPIAQAALTTAPDFTLPTDSGQVRLSTLEGKVVYLDFWASWCGPCRKSFPWMNELTQRYGKQGLVVVAVNLDKERDLAKTFLRDLPANFTVAYDPDGKVAEQYNVQGMPSSFIIDRNGKLVKTHMGFRQEDISNLESLLRITLDH